MIIGWPHGLSWWFIAVDNRWRLYSLIVKKCWCFTRIQSCGNQQNRGILMIGLANHDGGWKYNPCSILPKCADQLMITQGLLVSPVKPGSRDEVLRISCCWATNCLVQWYSPRQRGHIRYWGALDTWPPGHPYYLLLFPKNSEMRPRRFTVTQLFGEMGHQLFVIINPGNTY